MIKASPKIDGAKFIQADILTTDLPANDFTVMNYTLQFINPQKRLSVLRKINRALAKNHPLIISEKVKSEHAKIQKIIDANYLDFKRRNHYSKKEIYRKKASLEKILIPLTVSKLEKLLQLANFVCGPIYRHYNFVTYLCLKI
jgi:tRNA (cmo5U34)-methyltransferase